MKQWLERRRRGREISWLYAVWAFEREGYCKIISRTYMRGRSGKLIRRSIYWGCYRG